MKMLVSICLLCKQKFRQFLTVSWTKYKLKSEEIHIVHACTKLQALIYQTINMYNYVYTHQIVPSAY